MTIEEFFAGRSFSPTTTGTQGQETEWLEFCTLGVSGDQILIVDADFGPAEEEGLVITVVPGIYTAQVKAIDYDGCDARVSRLRVFTKDSSPSAGSLLDHTWTDTARTAFFDVAAVKSSWGDNIEYLDTYVRPATQTDAPYGIAVIGRSGRSVIPFVESGFGDGRFPVFELLEHGKRIGFEIEFIASDELYPF